MVGLWSSGCCHTHTNTEFGSLLLVLSVHWLVYLLFCYVLCDPTTNNTDSETVAVWPTVTLTITHTHKESTNRHGLVTLAHILWRLHWPQKALHHYELRIRRWCDYGHFCEISILLWVEFSGCCCCQRAQINNWQLSLEFFTNTNKSSVGQPH